MKSKYLIYIVCCFGWMSANAVGTETHGGDEVGLGFHQSMVEALKEVQNHSELSKLLPIQEILDQAKDVQIVIVDSTLDIKTQKIIQTSVAANIPEKKLIMINRSRWLQIEDPRLRKAIAFHEILSIKGFERTGYYPISAKYLALNGASGEDFNLALGMQVLNTKSSCINNLAKIGFRLNEFNARGVMRDCQEASVKGFVAELVGCMTTLKNAKMNFELTSTGTAFGYCRVHAIHGVAAPYSSCMKSLGDAGVDLNGQNVRHLFDMCSDEAFKEKKQQSEIPTKGEVQ